MRTCACAGAQVRALEEQVAAVFDDVTLGDMDTALEDEKSKRKRKGQGSSLRDKLLRRNT